MRKTYLGAAYLFAAAVVAMPAAAQAAKQTGAGAGGSPHYKTEWHIDGAHIAISYGRPSLKGRSDAQLMPAGRVWRTGADTATTLVIDKTLKFGTVTLTPGSYTINTQPGATDWQLVLGKLSSPGQWGVPYNATLEVGRATMALGKTAAPVEMLTISIDDTPAGATLRVEWGSTKATIPFTVEK